MMRRRRHQHTGKSHDLTQSTRVVGLVWPPSQGVMLAGRKGCGSCVQGGCQGVRSVDADAAYCTITMTLFDRTSLTV
eukprot:3639101-Pyramimonas_sp.AAC.1